MVIKLDEKNFYTVNHPLHALVKHFCVVKATRDLFAVANLLLLYLFVFHQYR